MKIGAITVGQSPRTDVTDDILHIFSGKAELIQKGALDGLSFEEIQALAPEEGDYILVSRMRDGTQVTFSERLVLPLIQQCIEEMEQEDAQIIIFFCTGEFLHTFRSKVPLIFPCHILNQIVPVLSGGQPVIIVNPSPSQKEQSLKKWSRYVGKATFAAASPYGGWEEIERVTRQIRGMEGNMVVLDCIGYSQKMKDKIAAETGKMVILSRTLLARAVSELTDIG